MMFNMKSRLTLLTGLLATPFITFAQGNFDNFENAMESIGNLIELAIPLLISVAVLVFIFGVIKFILGAGNDEKRKEGIKFIVSGLVGLFVILSLFALVRILQDTFGVDNENTVQQADIPFIPGVGDN